MQTKTLIVSSLHLLQLLWTTPQSTRDSGATAASCPWPRCPGLSSPSQRESRHIVNCLSSSFIPPSQKISFCRSRGRSVYCLCPKGSPENSQRGIKSNYQLEIKCYYCSNKVHLPVFTLPFTLPTLLIILSWRKQGQKWLDIQR